MGKQCQTLFFWAPKSLQMVIAAMKLKDAYSRKENKAIYWALVGLVVESSIPVKFSKLRLNTIISRYYGKKQQFIKKKKNNY